MPSKMLDHVATDVVNTVHPNALYRQVGPLHPMDPTDKKLRA